MNDYDIVELVILDKYGNPAEMKHKLKVGENVFKCLAVYKDGSKAEYSPYWTCPIIMNNTYAGKVDAMGVLGDNRKPSVVLNASKNHQRYTELGCWVNHPDSNSRMPSASIGFDYSLID